MKMFSEDVYYHQTYICIKTRDPDLIRLSGCIRFTVYNVSGNIFNFKNQNKSKILTI